MVMKSDPDFSWVTLVTCEEYDNKKDTYALRRVVSGVLMGIAAEE